MFVSVENSSCTKKHSKPSKPLLRRALYCVILVVEYEEREEKSVLGKSFQNTQGTQV